jgi:hypothetical protein
VRHARTLSVPGEPLTKGLDMASAHETPANTAMMGIVHSALRRDLTRTSTALSTRPAPGDVQRKALAAHLAWMMDFLHRHHDGEDAGLWPLVRSLNPSACELLDQMERDHARIAPAMETVSAATRDYAAGDSVQVRDRLLESLTSLRAVLDPTWSAKNWR